MAVEKLSAKPPLMFCSPSQLQDQISATSLEEKSHAGINSVTASCICASLQLVSVLQPVAGLFLGSTLTEVLTAVEMQGKLSSKGACPGAQLGGQSVLGGT